MCNECYQNPCHPRCPNAPDPEICGYCDCCDDEIREGDEYYMIGSSIFCHDCVRKGEKYAEIE